MARIITRPLGPWIEAVTIDRPRSPFSAAWTDTLNLLDREADYLGGELVVLQIDVTETDLRRDGLIRANARIAFPGVRVSLQAPFGPLAFATDVYPHWQANVRAIALGLEALRKVDRFGISRKGEQYVGWQALPGGGSPMSREEAAGLLAVDTDWSPTQLLADPEAVRRAHREQTRKYHPDRGGDTTLFARINVARDVLLAAP